MAHSAGDVPLVAAQPGAFDGDALAGIDEEEGATDGDALQDFSDIPRRRVSGYVREVV